MVIPKTLRRQLGIEKGLELRLTPLDENRLLLEKVPMLSQLFRSKGKARLGAILLEERRNERDSDEARLSELFARA